jgi:hypothetical protein
MKPTVRNLFFVFAALVLSLSTIGAAAGAGSNKNDAGLVFTVYPTGVDDTDNIQQAFAQAQSAGPRSTVLLAPGNFKIRLIEIWDFDGYFKGSGQDVTFIDTFPDQECQDLVYANRWPALLMFFRGYPRISDLTIHITPANACQIYNFPAGGSDFNITWIIGLEILTAPFNPETDCQEQKIEPVSGLVERVTIEAEDWDVYEQWTLWGALWFGGISGTGDLWSQDCPFHAKFSQGPFVIRQSTFRNSIYGLSPNNVKNSPVTMNHNFIEGNAVGIPVNDPSGSTLVISNNDLEAWGNGIVIFTGAANPVPYIASASTFNIHHNEINTVGDSIQLFDYENTETSYPPQGSRLIANIHHNHMTLYPDYFNAVWGEWVDNVLVHHNTIEGTSEYALAFGWLGPTRDGKILANDLSNYTSTTPVFNINLGWGTENYLVKGNINGSVLDEGTNNRIDNPLQASNLVLNARIPSEARRNPKMNWMIPQLRFLNIP